MRAPRRIGLIEGGVPEGVRLTEKLGPVTAEVEGGMFRGLVGLSREAEDALRRAAAGTGATHVIEARIAVRSGWFRSRAVASGQAVILDAPDLPP